jgi:hypothetical protein
LTLQKDISNYMGDELRKALEAIEQEAAALTEEIRAKSIRLDQLKITWDGLAKLLQDAPAEKDSRGRWYSSIVNPENLDMDDLGITDAIRRILSEAHSPMSPTQIKEALESGGLVLGGYANPHAVVHNTLKRLEKQGELLSVKDASGKVFAYTTKWRVG